MFDPFRRLRCNVRFYPVSDSASVPAEQLSELARSYQPDVVVLIHYFGAYREETVTLFRELFGGKALIIEDFAHTLRDRSTPLNGDLCVFSFHKTLGVADGSLILFGDGAAERSCSYAPPTALDRTLASRLRHRLLVEHLCATVARNRLLRRMLVAATRRASDYYPLLCEHYPSMRAQASIRSVRTLEHLDFDRIAEARRSAARLYCDRVDPRLMLDMPREALLRQSLFAFPLRVPDQAAFHAHLARRGVLGMVLRDQWWFSESAPSALYTHHFLLPLNHYLSEGEACRIIEAANAFAADGKVG
jgi:hypothetical protein